MQQMNATICKKNERKDVYHISATAGTYLTSSNCKELEKTKQSKQILMTIKI